MEKKKTAVKNVLLCVIVMLLSIWMQRAAVLLVTACGQLLNIQIPGVGAALCYHVSGIVLFGLWYRHLKKEPATGAFPAPKTIASVFLLGISVQFIGNIVMSLLAWLAPDRMQAYSDMITELQQSGGTAILMVLILLLGPIGEEFLCRGVILQYARCGTKSFWTANLIQALAFAVIHMNWVQGIYAFGAGLLLGVLTYWYRSIVPSVLLHILLNVLAPLPNLVYTASGESVPLLLLCYLAAPILLYVGIRLAKQESEWMRSH